ncbi:putative uncharacterized protein [Prevotella sp. CAG:755]|nr:putative uncharacterized protein [Prevotella sp. CAG:755]
MRKPVILLLLLAGLVQTADAADSTKARSFKDYLPEIHGTVRAKYEYQPQIHSGRFQVRNARFSLSGDVGRYVAYKAEIDLSDQGNIRMLDAYAQIKPADWGALTLGQMRVPFTIDAHRSPHVQYFPNRSFIAKQVGDVRDVGLAAAYKPQGIPLVAEAGLFNGKGLTEQKEWNKAVSFSAKVQAFPVKGWNVTVSMQKTRPAQTSLYMYDIGTYVEQGRWHVEAEYLYKRYADKAFSDVNAFNAFAVYSIPTRGFLSRVSILARYDMMQDHWDGVALDEDTHRPLITDWGRQRVTGGVTLGIRCPIAAELRLNYEKYFYDAGAIPDPSERDKAVVELMVRF